MSELRRYSATSITNSTAAELLHLVPNCQYIQTIHSFFFPQKMGVHKVRSVMPVFDGTINVSSALTIFLFGVTRRHYGCMYILLLYFLLVFLSMYKDGSSEPLRSTSQAALRRLRASHGGDSLGGVPQDIYVVTAAAASLGGVRSGGTRSHEPLSPG